MSININMVETQSPDPLPGQPRLETVMERLPEGGMRILYFTMVRKPWGTEKLRQHLRDHPDIVARLEKQLEER